MLLHLLSLCARTQAARLQGPRQARSVACARLQLPLEHQRKPVADAG